MAAMAGTSSDGQIKQSEPPNDYLKTLYPAVNEDETPLPRSWSTKDKYHYIGLSQINLRVHYKGLGKTHKDAASVRATHPIPASCGIYYFEVKIISKGRDGYMGIGLSVQGVNLNRLPGWDKHSYGYHGDDGHSFCSSGTGVPYGPTFSTGDVIGCCVNMIDNTCFYTKNGVSLGIAFRDLPPNLYPTVGLQTPGEVVEANFGYSPFVFDIEDYMREWRLKTQQTIERFPVEDKRGEWQTLLHKMVSTYLVHHGYCATAESFARSTGQAFEEELASIKNRQRIQRLVLAGRVGEAIETTQQLYPGLLERHPNLLFSLKCRQFIEMVNGTPNSTTDSIRSPRSQTSPSMSPMHLLSSASSSSTSMSAVAAAAARSSSSHILPPPNTAVTSSSSSVMKTSTPHHPLPPPPPPQQSSATSSSTSSSSTATTSPSSSASSTPTTGGGGGGASSNTPVQGVGGNNNNDGGAAGAAVLLNQEDMMNRVNAAMNGSSGGGNGTTATATTTDGRRMVDSDVDMDTCDSTEEDAEEEEDSRTTTSHNGVSNGVTNGAGEALQHLDEDEDDDFMDTDQDGGPRRQLCGGSQPAIERMLAFGRDLHTMSEKLKQEYGTNEGNKKVLHDAFSLLAYGDPWSSPVGNQLDPVQREPVCAALNSAILESHGLPKQPPLELAIGQATQCMKLMSKAGVGSCAFASVGDYLH